MSWKSKIEQWTRNYGCQRLRPFSTELVKVKLDSFRDIPIDFYGLYEESNGISCNEITVFALFNPDDVKRTWNSLERANTLQLSPYLKDLEERPMFFARFFIFALIGNEKCAVIDRKDGSIWYQESTKLHQTDTKLCEFIELCLEM